MSDRPPLLLVRGLAKRYGSIVALRSADLTVQPGEIHALLGANGAGKSTFVKILAGVIPADAGSVEVNGNPVRLRRPSDALVAGMATVFQDPALIPDLTIEQNLRLTGIEPGPVREGLERMGVDDLDVDAIVKEVPLPVLRVLDLTRALVARPPAARARRDHGGTTRRPRCARGRRHEGTAGAGAIGAIHHAPARRGPSRLRPGDDPARRSRRGRPRPRRGRRGPSGRGDARRGRRRFGGADRSVGAIGRCPSGAGISSVDVTRLPSRGVLRAPRRRDPRLGRARRPGSRPALRRALGRPAVRRRRDDRERSTDPPAVAVRCDPKRRRSHPIGSAPGPAAAAIGAGEPRVGAVQPSGALAPARQRRGAASERSRSNASRSIPGRIGRLGVCPAVTSRSSSSVDGSRPASEHFCASTRPGASTSGRRNRSTNCFGSWPTRASRSCTTRASWRRSRWSVIGCW